MVGPWKIVPVSKLVSKIDREKIFEIVVKYCILLIMPEPGLSEKPASRLLSRKSVFPRQDEVFPFSKKSSDPSRLIYQEDSIHGRSSPFPESGKVFWADPYGNLMFERGIKGFPHTTPSLYLHPSYRQGFCVKGLMRISYLKRTLAASRLMRSHGLPTERVIQAKKVEKVPFSGKVISIKEWKQKALEEWPESFKKREEKEPGFLERVKDSLTKETFVAIERDMPIGERLQDLRLISTSSAVREFFEKIFRYHNISLRRKPKSSRARELSATSTDDQVEFLSKILPTKIGEYLFKFHSLGLYHGFPTQHNWTMAACLVDLDSVRPILEKDPPTTLKDIQKDICQTIMAILFPVNIIGLSYFNDKSMSSTAIVNFLASYLKQFGESPDSTNQASIERHISRRRFTSLDPGFEISYPGVRLLTEAKRVIAQSK